VTTPPASPEAPFPLAPSGGQPPRRGRARKVLKWTAITMASVVLLGAGGVYADYLYLNHRIKHDCSLSDCIVDQGSRPPKAADAIKAQNFVLIGSDTRAGKSGKGTGGSNVQGARSDTTILMHISANNSGATLISIPRDSYVQIPSCVVGPNHKMSAPEMNKFNAAFSIGSEYDNKYGPACTAHTIETLTGIHIDHFAVVDFAGFQSMVSALGGVKMCVAHPLVDPVVDDNGAYHGSGLNLPAGPSVEINGFQALALMRARYALDGGGDLPRIKRQQQFIGAMIRKATSTGLLIDPPKLQSFLKAATGAISTDGFGLGTMHTLASALHNVGAGGVRLLTVPNLATYPGMPYGDVEWDPSKAPELWNAIKHDQPIPGTKTPKPTTSATPTSSPTPSRPKLSIPPSRITVNILNGTGQSGLAHRVQTALEAKGFQVGTVGDADNANYTSTIVKYGSDKKQSSQTVTTSIPGSTRQADPTLPSSTITVIVGSNYTKVVHVKVTGTTSPSSTPTPKISSFSAAKNGCLS
jgi:LCP family protein required for cell wall assembly